MIPKPDAVFFDNFGKYIVSSLFRLCSIFNLWHAIAIERTAWTIYANQKSDQWMAGQRVSSVCWLKSHTPFVYRNDATMCFISRDGLISAWIKPLRGLFAKYLIHSDIRSAVLLIVQPLGWQVLNNNYTRTLWSHQNSSVGRINDRLALMLIVWFKSSYRQADKTISENFEANVYKTVYTVFL